MNDTDVCVCGDIWDEHGKDKKHPTSTACNVEGCSCIAFEKDHEEEEGDD